MLPERQAERGFPMDDAFERERQWWDEKIFAEGSDIADEAVNRELRRREVNRNLEGVATVLDVGAGLGLFSIPLAKRGFQVTHLDISREALAATAEKTKGLENFQILEGNSTDLSRFPDRSFDLVLNFDGGVSFAGDYAEKAILESCRVTRKTLILTVSHRAWMVPVWLAGSMERFGRIIPAVYEMADNGRWDQSRHVENAELARGQVQDYVGNLRAFLPDQLRALLEGSGMRVVRCGGLGSLSNPLSKEMLLKIKSDKALFDEFLDLCERFDKEINPYGPGTRQLAGLLATAVR